MALHVKCGIEICPLCGAGRLPVIVQEMFEMPLVIDCTMPPGSFELRTPTQRVRVVNCDEG